MSLKIKHNKNEKRSHKEKQVTSHKEKCKHLNPARMKSRSFSSHLSLAHFVIPLRCVRSMTDCSALPCTTLRNQAGSMKSLQQWSFAT